MIPPRTGSAKKLNGKTSNRRRSKWVKLANQFKWVQLTTGSMSQIDKPVYRSQIHKLVQMGEIHKLVQMGEFHKPVLMGEIDQPDERVFISCWVSWIITAFSHHKYTYEFWKHIIYHGCSAKPATLALGKSSRRYESRANCEAHHLQPHGGQPEPDSLKRLSCWYTLQFVAFKMHKVKRTKHNRTATAERANRMSVINGFVYCSIFGY